MRKELLVAILAGTLFGVIGAFGIWKTNRNLDAQGITGVPTQNTLSPTPTLTEKVVQTEILTPKDRDVVFTYTIPFSGKSTPNSWIAISSDAEDSIIKTHEDGLFQQSVSLSSGINQVVVTIFDQGTPKDHILTLVHSSAFAGEGKITSYLGIVTDKTENSLQVKDEKGVILLLSIDPATASIVRTTDIGTKEAAYADIGIGDSIAALGIVGPSDVLDTKRILITPLKTSIKRKALMGTITTVSQRKVTFTVKDGTEVSIAPTKSLVITQGDTLEKIPFSDLSTDQTIIATGTLDGTDLAARRVQIVE